ncbi:hypothetical protein [Methylomicrobium lacus]|uniref:hypothetical protein n=1 Tax=Methylomicrobium lacus TaxID=136992 RepID=UPI0035A9451B
MNKIIDGSVRTNLAEMLYELTRRKGITVVEGHLIRGCVHIYMNSNEKKSMASMAGSFKEMRGEAMARKVRGRPGGFNGVLFGGQGKGVSAVSLNEAPVAESILDKENEDDYFVQSSWI